MDANSYLLVQSTHLGHTHTLPELQKHWVIELHDLGISSS